METDFKPRLKDWLATKEKNEQLIVANYMQIEMAQEVLKLCDKKIAEFPEEEDKIELT